MVKLSRFHKDVYFPEWLNEGFNSFYEQIYATGPLTFSAHAVAKTVEYLGVYGTYFFNKLMETVSSGALIKENLFEFYSMGKEQKIKKACFRYVMDNLPVDLVLVISDTCVIVTVYVVEKGVEHKFLNKNLYIKKRSKG